MVCNECAGDHGLPGTGCGHENAEFVRAKRVKCSLLIPTKFKGWRELI